MKTFFGTAFYFVFFLVWNSVRSEDCLNDPSAASCADAIYPSANATADADKLCAAMPYMIACTVRHLCKNGKASGPQCTDFSIVLDICQKDPQMEMMDGCGGGLAFCGPTSVVKQCKLEGPLPNILGTFAVKDDITVQCAASNPKPSGCTKYCPNGKTCTDYLSAMTENCLANDQLQGCESWKQMCNDLSTEMKAVCLASTSSHSDPACLTKPSDPKCADYEYSEEKAKTDVTALCLEKPNMIGCSIFHQCEVGKASGDYCKFISILYDICTVDAHNGDGCKNVNTLCSKDSAVKQCSSSIGALPNVPQTNDSIDNAVAQCETNKDLPGCSDCQNKTSCNDPLAVISANCQKDSTPKTCEQWNKLCKDIPKGMAVLCRADASDNANSDGSHPGSSNSNLISPQFIGSALTMSIITVLHNLMF